MAGKVLYSQSPLMFRNHPVYFVLGCIPIFWPAMLVWWLKCKEARLTLDETASVLQTGLLSKTVDEVEHRDVRNIIVHQSLGQRIFGTGDVRIGSAATGAEEIAVNGLPQPDRVREIIDRYKNAPEANG